MDLVSLSRIALEQQFNIMKFMENIWMNIVLCQKTGRVEIKKSGVVNSVFVVFLSWMKG